MDASLPADARCPQHPERAAAWVCPRCGSFFCLECERRTRADAWPMCPACWALRLEKVGPVVVPQPSTALQTVALVTGLLALLPELLFQIPSALVCILAIVLARGEAQKRARWRPIVGLILTCVGFVHAMTWVRA